MNNTEINYIWRIHRPFRFRSEQLRKRLLRRRFKLFWHKATYPAYVLIYVLFKLILLSLDWISVKLQRRTTYKKYKYDKMHITESRKVGILE